MSSETLDSRPADQLRVPVRLSRAVVVGTSGAGKTTMGGRLADLIGAPHIELDALHWEPNWTEAQLDVFRARVSEATAGDRWVVDGNYGMVRDLVWPRAELIVWLDYSIVRILRNLLARTSRRVVTKEELWGGNRENLRGVLLSRDSLFLWALKTHWRRRREYPERFREPELANTLVVRLRSPRAARVYFERLQRAQALGSD